MIRWNLLIINLLLLITAIFLGFYLFELINSTYDFESLAQNLNTATKKSISEVPKIEKKYKPNTVFFKDIIEKELFRPDRKEFIVEKKEEEKQEDDDMDEPNFIVRGIIIFNESSKSAIVEKLPSKNKPTRPTRGQRAKPDNNAKIPPKIYKEKDEIDSGWILKTIYPRRVEFCHGGNCFFVELYKTYEDANYQPPKFPTNTARKTRSSKPRTERTKSTEFSAEEFKRLIQRGGRKKP